jgi:hypothetical protein
LVPASDVGADGSVMGQVHHWNVVQQAGDKWRACQNCHDGTNRRVMSTPFTMVWREVRVAYHWARH